MRKPAKKLLGSVTDMVFGLDYSSRVGGQDEVEPAFTAVLSLIHLFIRCLCVGLWTDRVAVESVNLR